LVLRSAKAASFCHGLDSAWLAAHASPEELAALAHHGQKLCDKIAGCQSPAWR